MNDQHRAAVSFVKRFLGKIGDPVSVGFQHGVEDDKELAHAGGDHDFEFFSLVFEALCESCDDGVPGSGCQGRHVEDVSDGSPATTNGAGAVEFAAVAVVGRQASQGADLFTIERPQLRKFCEESDGGDVPDTGRAAEQLDFFLRIIVGLKEFGDFLFNSLDLCIEHVDDLLNTLTNRGHRAGFTAVGFRCAKLDKLPAPTNQLLQFGLILRQFRGCAGLHMLAKSSDDLGINAIGLGQDAEGLREVPNLSRVDDGHEVAGIEEFGDEAAVVTSSRFNHDQTSPRLRQLTVKLLQAGSIVANREGFTVGQDAGFERALGNINSDERRDRSFHEFVPVLQMRTLRGRRPAKVPAAVRARTRKPATILLCGGLGRPGHFRSVAGRSGKSCSATLRSSFHCGINLNVSL